MNAEVLPDVLLGVVVFVLGALVGSFLNVAVDRRLAGRSIVFPPSACENCDKPLRPWELVPVLSWLALRGRCSRCKVSLSVQYPLVELAGGLLALLSWHLAGTGVTAALLFVGLAALFAASLVDIKSFDLPDSMVLGAGGLAVVASIASVTSAGHDSLAAQMLLFGAVAAGVLGGLDAAFTALRRLFRPRRASGAADYPLAVLALALGAVLAPVVGSGASVLLLVLAVTVVFGVAIYRTGFVRPVARLLAAAEVPLLLVTAVTVAVRALSGHGQGVPTFLSAFGWFGMALLGLGLLWAPALLDSRRAAHLAEVDQLPEGAGDPVAVGFGDVKLAFVLGALLTLALGKSGIASAAMWLVPGSMLVALVLSILKIRRLPFGPLLMISGVLALMWPTLPLSVIGY